MALPEEKIYTIEDIYALPEGRRAELINGQIYNMAPPGRIHQRLIHQLEKCIGNYIDSNHGNCEVYPAPFAVFLNTDDVNYVEPDISIICDKSKLDDRGCNGAPDWIIEIVSPGSRRMDYNIKNGKYAESGVREYWIVDPAKERTTVYMFEEDAAPAIIPFGRAIVSGIYDDLQITIADLLQ